MQTQKIGFNILNTRRSTDNKNNPLTFMGGGLYYLDSDLGYLAAESTKTGRALQKFKSAIGNYTKGNLRVYIWKIPKMEIESASAKSSQNISNRYKNIIIEYHDTKNNKSIDSRHCLDPALDEDENFKNLWTNLLLNAKKYTNFNYWLKRKTNSVNFY